MLDIYIGFSKCKCIGILIIFFYKNSFPSMKIILILPHFDIYNTSTYDILIQLCMVAKYNKIFDIIKF